MHLRSAIVPRANRNVQKYFENDEKVAKEPDRRRANLSRAVNRQPGFRPGDP